MPSQQPHAGDVIRRPSFQRKTSCGHAALDIRDRKYLTKAREQGYLKPDVNPRQVAEFVVMVEEGAFAMVKNLRDKKVYWSLYESLKRYLESISQKPTEQLSA